MSHRHFSFYIHVGKEWSLIVHPERKDAMLIRKLEGTAEDGAISCLRDGLQIKTMIRREHGKFKLQSVRGIHLEWTEMVVNIFRDLDIERLGQSLSAPVGAAWRSALTTSFLTRYIVGFRYPS